MKIILSVALLMIALGVSAYVWKERYPRRPVNAQAVAPDKARSAESVADVDIEGVKRRCFDVSKEAILKELNAPQTAVFPNALSEVKFQRGEADSYQMSSHVDAQDASGAPIRMKWETLFDKDKSLVWMKIDEDELEPLEDVLRRLKGLPPREDERGLASEEGERARQATGDGASKEHDGLKDPKYREPFHAYAERYVTTRMELQSHRDIKHSKLPKKDNKFTACYWLGNDVWEATGLVESIPPNRRRLVRQPWKVSMAVSADNNEPEVLAYQLGKEEVGDPDGPRIRAGIQPTLSK